MALKIEKTQYFHFFSPISQTVNQYRHLNTQKIRPDWVWANFKSGHPKFMTGDKCTKNENCQFEAYSKRSLLSHIGGFHKEWEIRGRGHERCSKKGCSASFKHPLLLKRHENVHDNILQFKGPVGPFRSNFGYLYYVRQRMYHSIGNIKNINYDSLIMTHQLWLISGWSYWILESWNGKNLRSLE